MAYVTGNRSAVFSFGDRISMMVAQLQEARAKRNLINKTYNELNALSNAELADIGINRSMIRAIAIEAAEQA